MLCSICCIDILQVHSLVALIFMNIRFTYQRIICIMCHNFLFLQTLVGFCGTINGCLTKEYALNCYKHCCFIVDEFVWCQNFGVHNDRLHGLISPLYIKSLIIFFFHFFYFTTLYDHSSDLN